jgi:hypothetical protein
MLVRGWSPGMHWTYPVRFRQRVRTVMMVAERLDRLHEGPLELDGAGDLVARGSDQLAIFATNRSVAKLRTGSMQYVSLPPELWQLALQFVSRDWFD